jgi:protein SCO1/2
MKYWARLAAALFLLASSGWAAQKYSVTGLVLKVDQHHKTFTVSCDSIPGHMDAMIMPFEVRDGKVLDGVAPGMAVDFALIIEKDSNYAEQIKIRRYEGAEQDPLTARRLKLLSQLSHPAAESNTKALAIGQPVPDFTLMDQSRHQVSLSQFAGKVVAMNFIYTSCALPNFCFRNSNTFGVLQRRFREKMGKDLVLLTVTFDPQHDRPDVLARYANTWKADPATWHFLTGPVPEVQHVTEMFGMDYFPDEGLMNHSLHTAIIDRKGKLVANIEGNQFTADQLGDLVEAVLPRKVGGHTGPETRLAHIQGSGPSSPR